MDADIRRTLQTRSPNKPTYKKDPAVALPDCKGPNKAP